ncbi:MAG: hypothetical protein Q8O88_02575 [bacterium]|nr:hypothetical protein [bacterium]
MTRVRTEENPALMGKNGRFQKPFQFGAPDVLLHRLTGFIQEFSSSPILPDFLYELQPELASKMPINK